MVIPRWREEPISKEHDRRGFDCGNADLNEFLRSYARQSHERGAAKTFVAVDAGDEKRILGYYSLSPASIDYASSPNAIRKGLGHHDVGAFRLARLATSLDVQGQGLGGQLLLAAGRRCLRVAAEVGGTVMLIDAKNERAAAWYESFGSMRLIDASLSLVLPLLTIEMALKASNKL